jgi:hypothetical protein
MKLHAYRHVNVDRPEWAPLQRLALGLTAYPDVPPIHPADFTWLAELESLDGGPAMHLYKHVVTRMYLSLDTDLRTYVYVDGDHHRPFFEAAVYFRRLRGVAAAIERLELHQFDLATGRRLDAPVGELPHNVVPLVPRRPRRGSVA